MHLNFAFSARQVLWTLTFAVQLVLLMVLLGRDRVRRYPWFTASLALFSVRLLSEILLAGRMPMLTLQEIFLTLADLAALVSLLVIAEIAWQAFKGAKRLTWIIGVVALVAVAAGVLAVETLGLAGTGKLVYFMSVERAKFRRPVVPGDQLRIHVTKERCRGNVWKFNAIARVDGLSVAEATYTAMIMDQLAER